MLVKGSSALYLNNVLSREPNDIDLIIDNEYLEYQNEETWIKMVNNFLVIDETVDNTLIKSLIIGWNKKLIQLEWMTRESIEKPYAQKNI